MAIRSIIPVSLWFKNRKFAKFWGLFIESVLILLIEKRVSHEDSSSTGEKENRKIPFLRQISTGKQYLNNKFPPRFQFSPH